MIFFAIKPQILIEQASSLPSLYKTAKNSVCQMIAIPVFQIENLTTNRERIYVFVLFSPALFPVRKASQYAGNFGVIFRQESPVSFVGKGRKNLQLSWQIIAFIIESCKIMQLNRKSLKPY